jgi:hypothetical protein
MLHIVYGELLNSDPDPENIFRIRIRQKDVDPTGSGSWSETLVKHHIHTRSRSQAKKPWLRLQQKGSASPAPQHCYQIRIPTLRAVKCNTGTAALQCGWKSRKTFILVSSDLPLQLENQEKHLLLLDLSFIFQFRVIDRYWKSNLYIYGLIFLDR